MPSAATEAIERAKRTASNATKRANDAIKSGAAQARELRKAAKTSVDAANKMSLLEAPVGGALAGALDELVKPLGGLVPVSLPAALVVGGAGWFLKMPDVLRVGAGMAAGAAYNLAGGLVATIKAIAALGKK